MDEGSPLEEIKESAKKSDIIFSATGKPDLLLKDDLKKGCVVIDIGISPDPKKPGQVRGDIAEDVKKKQCSFYSPVPKGVGPMTMASLMFNTFKAWKKQIEQY